MGESRTERCVTVASCADVQPGARALPGIRIQIFHVPDCPLTGRLRALVHRVLARHGLNAPVDVIEAPYPSPTLVINGTDATGARLDSGPSCRLGLPTERQITSALAQAAGQQLLEKPSGPTAQNRRQPG